MNELDKLRTMLDDAGIPYESIQEERAEVPDFAKKMFGEAAKWTRNQVIYGGRVGDHWRWDGICQYGSYGAAKGMIETYGTLGWDKKHNPQVMGAEDAFAVIAADWSTRRKKGENNEQTTS